MKLLGGGFNARNPVHTRSQVLFDQRLTASCQDLIQMELFTRLPRWGKKTEHKPKLLISTVPKCAVLQEARKPYTLGC